MAKFNKLAPAPKPPVPGGNGHDHTEWDLPGTDFFNEAFQPGSQSSAAKELTHAGETIEELIIKSRLKNDQHLIQVIRLYNKCKRFNVKRGMDLVKLYIVGQVGIDGLARRQLIEALTGNMAPELYGRKQQQERSSGNKE